MSNVQGIHLELKILSILFRHFLRQFTIAFLNAFQLLLVVCNEQNSFLAKYQESFLTLLLWSNIFHYYVFLKEVNLPLTKRQSNLWLVSKHLLDVWVLKAVYKLNCSQGHLWRITPKITVYERGGCGRGRLRIDPDFSFLPRLTYFSLVTCLRWSFIMKS